jgi:hypothetical protein
MSANAASTDPYLAYAFPAGASQGTTIRVEVAGQFLKGGTIALISGEGVTGRVVDYVGAGGPLSKVQEDELDRILRRLMGKAKGGTEAPEAAAAAVALPDLPLLRDLASRRPEELAAIRARFLDKANRPKPPMAEIATLELSVAPGAKPGNRELRLLTPQGLSNPLVFQVSRLTELVEADPLDRTAPPPSVPLALPRVLNGRILQGETDRQAFALRKGQEALFALQARNLIPYLADAVPGWFQAFLSIEDDSGHELAWADDNGSDPDPVLRFVAPRDGSYSLVIRDAIHRGRQDFVYRVYAFSDAEAAVQFPTGSLSGMPVAARPRAALGEVEPDDGAAGANALALGKPVAGSIGSPGDIDLYRFDGKAGEAVVAGIVARQDGSPLDSFLRLLDKDLKPLAVNDDFADIILGLSAHHADSRLMARLPADGPYFLEVTDAARRGGPDYRYSLLLGRPDPGFTLLTTRSALNLLPGGSAELEVRVQRRDGWEGDIAIDLAGKPKGFVLEGGLIRSGADRVRLTVTALPSAPAGPVELSLIGHGLVGGMERGEAVRAADLRMEAFGNTHLVPAQGFFATVLQGKGRLPALLPEGGWKLSLKAGSGSTLRIALKDAPKGRLVAELVDPPPGLSLASAVIDKASILLGFEAAAGTKAYEGNLIVAIALEVESTDKDGKASTRRTALGTLPAISVRLSP